VKKEEKKQRNEPTKAHNRENFQRDTKRRGFVTEMNSRTICGMATPIVNITANARMNEEDKGRMSVLFAKRRIQCL
jgi:hypothetical protein